MLTNLINVPVIKVNKEKVKRKESILSFLIYEWLPKRKRNKKRSMVSLARLGVIKPRHEFWLPNFGIFENSNVFRDH